MVNRADYILVVNSRLNVEFEDDIRSKFFPHFLQLINNHLVIDNLVILNNNVSR